MSDLFGFERTAVNDGENGGERRQKTYRRSPPPYGGMPNDGTRPSPPRTSEKVGIPPVGGVGPRPKRGTTIDKSETRRKLNQAMTELGSWRDSLRVSKAALAPHDAVFREAHDACAQAVNDRSGPRPSRSVLASYDRRLEAGVVAHPFRKIVREAESVVKELTKHVRELNEEMES